MPKTSKEAKLSAVPNPSVLPASRFTICYYPLTLKS